MNEISIVIDDSAVPFFKMSFMQLIPITKSQQKIASETLMFVLLLHSQ